MTKGWNFWLPCTQFYFLFYFSCIFDYLKFDTLLKKACGSINVVTLLLRYFVLKKICMLKYLCNETIHPDLGNVVKSVYSENLQNFRNNSIKNLLTNFREIIQIKYVS